MVDATLDVLAIAAHPDDVEQTCGGTLLRMAEMGYRTGILDLTAGEMGTRGTPDLRLQEAERARIILRANWRGNCHFPDVRFEDSFQNRAAVACFVRALRPRTVILPYWEGRHPDHYRASELAYQACFLAGLRKLEADTEPHRPSKVLYASMYANVKPTFVVDISGQFERRMDALLAYASQYGEQANAAGLFPTQSEIRERLAAIARFYGNQIGVKYGEPFVVKETMRVDDVVTLGPRSF